MMVRGDDGQPPPLGKREEKYREEILEQVEEGCQAEEWATRISQIVNELLLRNLFESRTPQAARTDRAARLLMDPHERTRKSPHNLMPTNGN